MRSLSGLAGSFLVATSLLAASVSAAPYYTQNGTMHIRVSAGPVLPIGSVEFLSPSVNLATVGDRPVSSSLTRGKLSNKLSAFGSAGLFSNISEEIAGGVELGYFYVNMNRLDTPQVASDIVGHIGSLRAGFKYAHPISDDGLYFLTLKAMVGPGYDFTERPLRSAWRLSTVAGVALEKLVKPNLVAGVGYELNTLKDIVNDAPEPFSDTLFNHLVSFSVNYLL